MSKCRGCSTQEEVQAANAIRRAQIKQWQAEQVAYDRAAHGFTPETEEEDKTEKDTDSFWKEIETEQPTETLVGTAEPQPQSFEPEKEKETPPKRAPRKSASTPKT